MARSIFNIELYSELKSLMKYWYGLVSILLALVIKVNKFLKNIEKNRNKLDLSINLAYYVFLYLIKNDV